jgi:hypothetical protein
VIPRRMVELDQDICEVYDHYMEILDRSMEWLAHDFKIENR